MNKAIETKYGVTAEWHVPKTGSIEQSSEGIITCDFHVLLYLNESAFLSGNDFLDCFRPALKLSITPTEKKEAVGNHDLEQIANAFFKKYQVSYPDDNGTETNTFSGISGKISYVAGIGE